MAFRLFPRKAKVDAHDDCRVPAELHLDGDLKLPGMIMKIGAGVVLFREASAYVLVRDEAQVHVVFDGGEIDGVIMRSSPEGYLIKSTAERFAA